MLSLLEPEIKEVELGKAEIRQVFTIGKTTRIAGCYVTEGKIVRSKDAVLIRDGKEIFRGAIDQLKRFKDDVKEVAQGLNAVYLSLNSTILKSVILSKFQLKKK